MARFEVDGTEYELVESPTFGEARAIEKITGRSFAAMGDKSAQTIDFLQALIWISMKRVNPDTKFEDLDDLDIGVLQAVQQEEKPDVPLGDSADSEAATASA